MKIMWWSMLRAQSVRIAYLSLVTATLGVVPAFGDDWLPVTPEELKMTSTPLAPGAPAVILYRQVDRDDNAPGELNYVRIKILTDEGRKYGDVQLEFDKQEENIRYIEGRTIHPDGSITKFDGTVYEKPIVQSRGVKLLAKTFTMPDVEVGSIIEYRYHRYFSEGYVFNSHWILSQDLFTLNAKFSLSPYREFTLTYEWPQSLPDGTAPPKEKNGAIRMETHNVPAFVQEDFAPPTDELKYRVDFIYSGEDAIVESKPDVYWKKFGKKEAGKVNDFLDRRKAMEQAVAQIVQPGDSPDTKLHKLYERTQQLRNLSFEAEKTSDEIKRDKIKDARNVEDVWNAGAGNGIQLTWLFVALARTAGLQVDPVIVATRDQFFFNKQMMNSNELNSNVALVTLDGKEFYLDPGVPFTPYGQLPWNETAVAGLRLDKDGGSWVTTPLPDPAASRISRKADLKLAADGTLQGKVTITYSGLEALWRRLEERNEDDADRKQFLEDAFKSSVPSGIDVTLSNAPDWKSSNPTLTAEFDLKVPGWAASAGQRRLVPIGLFTAGEQHTFEHAARVHPLYFDYPYEHDDDIFINLPAEWQISSVPADTGSDQKLLVYDLRSQSSSHAVIIRRKLVLNLNYLDTKYYPQLRDFFQAVRTGDEGQIVAAPIAAAVKH